MNNAQILVNNTEGTQPICVYRWSEDHLCLFYGYVNLGMCRTCFAKLCQSIFEMHRQLEQGDVEASHMTVNYASTTLVLPVDDFRLLSDSLAQAREQLEFLENCEDARIAPPREECEHFAEKPFLFFLQLHKRHIHLN